MANTAITNDEEIKEHFESFEETDKKAKILANWILESNNFVCYTGAGISTAAGIPDFRSPKGVWTLKAKNELHKLPKRPSKIMPTKTHMSLVKLAEEKHLKLLVSQNCDGLHIRSGYPAELLCELHGNSEVESCPDCGLCIHRNQPVMGRRNGYMLTGRKCKCGGKFRYTTVAFNQSMPDLCLNKAEKFSKKADLALAMGTSMRVYPAADLPLMLKQRSSSKKGRFVIVNLQKTPVDKYCDLRFFQKTDIVMELVMKHLKLKIPETQFIQIKDDPKQFSKKWKFRSAPDHSWCTPKNKPALKRQTQITSGARSNSNLTAQTDLGGYVDPVCCKIHTKKICSKEISFGEAVCILKGKCSSCSNVKENWICLECRQICCGRYISKHMIEHHKKTGHNIVLSLSDLNTWCYACDGYIISKEIDPIYSSLYFAKFGEEPPFFPYQKHQQRNKNIEKISEHF